LIEKATVNVCCNTAIVRKLGFALLVICVNLIDRVIIAKCKFPKVVWQLYVGKVGKSVTVVLPIVSVYCVPDFIGIGLSS